MLRSSKDLLGKKVNAEDGSIGHIYDLYFEDDEWAIY
jgi:hypothetical protein